MPKGTGQRVAQAEGTRSALIAAARQLFANNGFHATGTHEIVQLAGVSRGALQHHFPRKEELFKAVFEAVEQDLIAKARQKDDAAVGEAWAALRTDFGAFLEAATQPEVQQIILIDGPVVLGWAEWRRLESQYGLGVIERAVTDGIAAGQIRPQSASPLAHLIFAVIDEAALMVANATDKASARREADIAVDTLLSSLK